MDRKFIVGILIAWAITILLDGIAYWYFKQVTPEQGSYIGMHQYINTTKRGN